MKRLKDIKKTSYLPTIRVEPDVLAKIREIAKNKGLNVTNLVRMWVYEGLGKEKQFQKTKLK